MFRDEDDEGSTEEESSAPEQEKPKDPVAEAREKLWAYCEEKGLLRRIKKGEHKDSLRWREGLRRNSVIAELERYGAPDNLCEEMLAAYDDYAFNPFHHVALDSRERIKILTGANSNGKSTLMRSIALALNTGMVGRKIQAKGSEMSFCDGIFHDFEVHDDVQEGVSTFRAQVRNVLTFLRDGTPYSLGLFDEMYHGTSSLYLLALAWATIESFSQRNLRAIISTHEPLLTFSTRGDGLSLLRGIYAKQKKMIGGAVNGGIEGVGNISLRNHYELRPGAVMDSDAFRVAREEKMPTKLLRRAAHIKEVLMDEGAQ
jgi:DNA mismatch repair ATPase MutS